MDLSHTEARRCFCRVRASARSAALYAPPFKPAESTRHLVGLMLSTVLLVASPLASAEHLADTVTVTAPVIDRSLPDIGAARARLDQVPGGTDVVDSERYRDGRASTLADMLQASPGVFAQSRFGAEESRISIRGSGLQRTFHGRGLLLLQDGVPLNLADGGVDMQAIEPLATRYTEVYRGANATPYGATTLGGAINFVSFSGRDAPGLQARVEAGSFGYKRASVGYGFVDGKLDGFVSASEFYQDGYRDHARQNTQRAFANLGYDFGGGVRSRFFLTGVNTESQLPGNLTLAQLRANPEQANPANLTGNQQRNFQLWRIANRTTWTVSSGLDFELLTYGMSKQLFHPIFQVIEQDSTDYGLQFRVNQRGHLFGLHNQLSWGVLANRGFVDEGQFANVGGRPGARRENNTQDSSNTGVFVEDTVQITEPLSLIAGGHWTRSTRDKRDFFLGESGCGNPASATAPCNDSVAQAFERWLPRIGLHYALTPSTAVFANWSGSFEPPSLSEVSNAFAGEQRANRAQRGQTFELGTRGSSQVGAYGLAWDVAVYRAELRDELLQLTLPSGATATVNADRTLHQGIEAGWRVGRGAWLWSTTATWQDLRFDGDSRYRDNTLAGLPEAFGVTELRWTGPAGLYVAPALQAASRSWVDFANTLKSAGYGIVNLRVGQRQSDGWGWFVEGRNLFDRRYSATTGVMRDAAGRDQAQFLPGDGVAVYAGLEYRPK